MNTNRLARWAIAPHLLGADLAPWLDPFGTIPLHGLPFAAGDGATGGAGADLGDGEDDDTGAGKPLSEMTPEEQVAYWKRQARANERKLKGTPKPEELAALRNAKVELDKLTEATKSDTERLATRADKAEKRAAELEPKVLRLEVALEHGLPKALAHRLVGDTREELEADAKELLKLSGGKDTGTTGSSGARGQDGGVRGSAKDTKLSAREAGLEEAKRRFGATTTAGAS